METSASPPSNEPLLRRPKVLHKGLIKRHFSSELDFGLFLGESDTIKNASEMYVIFKYRVFLFDFAKETSSSRFPWKTCLVFTDCSLRANGYQVVLGNYKLISYLVINESWMIRFHVPFEWLSKVVFFDYGQCLS